MKNFRTYDLAVEFYRQATALGLKGDARDQLTRASRSIVLNLAEGRGRRTLKDRVKFFHIALGSLRECQAVLDLEFPIDLELQDAADRLGAHLFKLIRNAA